MRIYYPILFFIIFSFWSCQEDKIEPDLFGSLSGQVIFEANGQPASEVSISTSPATSTLLSLQDGSFEFPSIKVGTYSIRAELDGYLTAIESITIEESRHSSVTLKLKPGQDNNFPPGMAAMPFPINAANDQEIMLELSWEASDPDEDDLTFDVYLFNSNQSPNNLIAEGISEKKLQVSDLKYATTYYWQVVVKDGLANPVYGEVWSFTTQPFPNHSFVFSKINNGVYEIFSGDMVNEFYQLTTGGSNYRPRFSPLGNRIAFINANYPEKRLMAMNRDASEIVLVETPFPIEGSNDLELNYTWSPDGTQLLYMRGKRLYKINIDGTTPELFAALPDEEFVEVDWTGVGNRIVARTVGDLPYESRILLFDGNGNFLEEVVPDVPGSIGGPTFSIDGNSILYTRDTSGFESDDGRQLESHIFLKNLNTGVIKDLSHDKPLGFNDLEPRFSPNGALIVFTQTNNFPNSEKDIYIMNIDGDGRILLFENSEMADWWD